MRATAMPRRGSCRMRQHPGGLRDGRYLVRLLREKAATKGYVAPGTQAWEPGTSCRSTRTRSVPRRSVPRPHARMTRLNVYAGPRGSSSSAAARRVTTRCATPAADGRPCCPARRDGERPLPAHKTYYEIPIAIQDRSFNADARCSTPIARVLRRHRRAVPAAGLARHDGGHAAASRRSGTRNSSATC